MKDRQNDNRKRWQAVVTYSTAAGPLDVPHEIEELSEIEALVERGPDWRTIDEIKITYALREQPMTIETADAENSGSKAP